MAGRESEYADVAGMFCHLQTLDEGSAAFLRQREAIIRRCMPLPITLHGATAAEANRLTISSKQRASV